MSKAAEAAAFVVLKDVDDRVVAERGDVAPLRLRIDGKMVDAPLDAGRPWAPPEEKKM